MRLIVALVIATLVVGVTLPVQAQGTKARSQKFHVWLYWRNGIGSDQQVTKTQDIILRMKKAGYTGIAVLDDKLQKVQEQTPQYQRNLGRIREACTDAGLDLIVATLPLGYANGMMTVNPNLAAAMPVVDGPFVVRDGKIVPDDPTTLVNGDFTDSKDNIPTGWGVDAPGRGLYVDTDVTYRDKPSIRMEDIEKNGEAGHMRAYQTIKVKPFQYYHLSVAVKTQNYQGKDNRLMALGQRGQHEGRLLNLTELYGLKPTQDWEVFHKTFNTQDFTEVAVYIGSWAGRTGTIWFADVRMEPAGLSNMVRRPGAPLKAGSPDGKTTYVEGRDIPEMQDPGLGKSPYRGGYQWHEGPLPVLPAGSRIKEGDKLLLSYYHTAVMSYNDQVPMCLSEPETLRICEDIVRSTAKNLQPDYWFLEHDEIRMMGWCKTCTDDGKTCGEILGDHITKCYGMIKKAQPGVKGVYVWNDMFDPYHNAGDQEYMLVRGKSGWYKSWEGMAKAMGLINWNANKADSVKFFSDLGRPQILSGGPGVVNALRRSANLKGVTGAIYVTWSNDYGPTVEKFATDVLKWKNEQK